MSDAGQPTTHLSAGVVVVRQQQGQWYFLLLRAYRNWDFPKGIVEAGENPRAAACREVCEESTIDQLEFRWGDTYRETGPYSRSKIARYYIAATQTEHVELPVNPQLGKPEHHEWRWVAYPEALTLVSPRVAPIVEWAHATINGGEAPRAG